jgi:hypothetical protein
MNERRGMAAGVPGNILLALVIPAYNEQLRLAAGVTRLQAAIDEGMVDVTTTEFIVVDDGSSDDTERCAKELYGAFPRSTVLRLPQNRGKGAAVRAGVAATTAATIAFADADMAIDPRQIPRFLDALQQNDLAIGSRAARGASVDRASLRRSVMNRTFNRFVNTVTGVSLDDTQCGFKAFRGPMARLLFHCSTTDRMAFDVELLALARQLGLRIAQIPVQWSRVEGSRVRSWSDAGSMVRDVLAARSKLIGAPPLTVGRLGVPQLATSEAVSSLALLAPVVTASNGELLALFPFMDEESAAALAEAYGLPGLPLETMPAARLRSLAPFSLEARTPSATPSST